MEGPPLHYLLARQVATLADVDGRVRAATLQARRALAEAEAAWERAEQARQSKSEFLSQASRELRTLLNVILGFGQLLALSELDDKHANDVEEILDAGRHLLDLMHEIIDVAQAIPGALSLPDTPVNLSEVTARCGRRDDPTGTAARQENPRTRSSGENR